MAYFPFGHKIFRDVLTWNIEDGTFVVTGMKNKYSTEADGPEGVIAISEEAFAGMSILKQVRSSIAPRLKISVVMPIANHRDGIRNGKMVAAPKYTGIKPPPSPSSKSGKSPEFREISRHFIKKQTVYQRRRRAIDTRFSLSILLG
ncbi:MAG: hypothetical protein IJY04_00055 [Clostridia bacterium]|nr:hypothetical protein [Clostridia bacterium]